MRCAGLFTGFSARCERAFFRPQSDKTDLPGSVVFFRTLTVINGYSVGFTVFLRPQ
jgi:hypothetical protein